MIYTRRSKSFIVSMNAVHLGTNYVWISFESLIIPTQIQMNSNSNSFLLGIIAAVGIGIGVLISLFFGTISDRFSFLWGKRGPYIIFGSLFASLSIIFDLLIQNFFIGSLIGYILIQTGTNISSGAYQPLFRDLIKQEQRGFATGINGVFTLLGNALGLGLTGYLISIHHYQLSFLIMAVILFLTALITAITIKHDDVHHIFVKHGTRRRGQKIISSVNVDKKFATLVLASFVFFLGISGLSFFELYYFEDVLLSKDAAYLVTISGIFVLLFSALGTALFGYISDKIGRLKILVFASFISAIAMFMIPTFPTFDNFLVFGTFAGLGYGIFFSVSKALASDMSPIESSGRYMAIYNIAVGGSAAVSPFIFGSILDYFTKNIVFGFTVLFEITALFYLLAIMFLLPLRTGRKVKIEKSVNT
ncbi:MFS transporter [Cuniculiplasma sp. SKW3]|uniref:MFS transporter n=1 Tax=unclassified Cuniculiplasma TaxID=2619706 RepID=UPI003FD6AB20